MNDLNSERIRGKTDATRRNTKSNTDATTQSPIRKESETGTNLKGLQSSAKEFVKGACERSLRSRHCWNFDNIDTTKF